MRGRIGYAPNAAPYLRSTFLERFLVAGSLCPVTPERLKKVSSMVVL